MKPKKILWGFVVLFNSVFCVITTSFPQEQIFSTLGVSFKSSTIFLIEGDSIKKIFEDSTRIFRDHRIQQSPDKKLIAAISSSRGFIGQDENAYIDHKLLIFTEKGELKRIVPNVQRYSWSPNGKMIACIIGKDVEGFGFASWGLKIINTLDWTEKTFDEHYGQDIYWAEFDSMIYTTDFVTVYKIDPRNGNRTPTSYKGIYFSPDGKYYFSANYEGGGFAVYDRKSNRDVTPREWKENATKINFHRWLPKSSILIAGDIIREKKVIDMVSGKVLKGFDGHMIGFDEKTRETIVYKDKRHFKSLNESKLERIKLSVE